MQHYNISVILTVKNVSKSTRISKIAYVKGVANRHVISNYMHIGHTRYTSTLVNIKIQYVHDFISPTFYKNKIENILL